MVRIGRILSDLVRFGRIWSDLVGFCRNWSDLVGFGRNWSDFVGFGQILISGKSGRNLSELVGIGPNFFVFNLSVEYRVEFLDEQSLVDSSDFCTSLLMNQLKFDNFCLEC